MLKIYDKYHNTIGYMSRCKDLKVESEVKTGDKTLSFVPLDALKIENEYYIDDGQDEYVVKEADENLDGVTQIVAVLNLEELEGKVWVSFSVKDSTIEEAARLALAGTGWTVGECTVTKRRNAGMLQVSSRTVIDKLCTAFMCERVYDTRKKTVSFYEEVGADKGVYFLRGLNLKKLNKKSDTYDYYTRIIPIGANGLTIEKVNGGKNYLENFQYSNKVRTYIWKDESYTDAQALMEDAQWKLEDMSKPITSYSADVIDLAKQKSGYSVLSYNVGDRITIIDVGTKTREKQRIVKTVQYPYNHSKDRCELANTVLTFEEMQQAYKEASDIINTVISGDGRYTGKINVSDILHFEEGLSGSSAIGGLQGSIDGLNGQLKELKLAVGSMETNYLKAEEAELRYAKIENLEVTNEKVHSIEGEYASFKSTVMDELAAKQATIDNLTGDLSNFKTSISEEMITAKGWMLEGSIGSAQISDLDVNKLNSGTIYTTVVRLASPDSAVEVTGSQILVNDSTDPLKPMNRVMLGKYRDATEAVQYGLLVRSEDGQTVMIDGKGVHNAGITDGAVDNNKVADDANIDSGKIDYHNMNTVLTEQGVLISQTVVQVGDKTLNVVLEEQFQEITEAGERLETHEARILANEESIALKVSTQVYQKDHEDMVSSLSKATSDISVLQGQISLKVEQTDINKSLAGYSTTDQMTAAITAAKDNITTSVSEIYTTKSETADITGKVSDLESWKTEASQKITADSIISTVTKSGQYQNDLAERVSNTDLTSKIEQWFDSITIQASKIRLEGYVTANEGFAIDKKGSIIAKDGNFQGKINATFIKAKQTYSIYSEEDTDYRDVIVYDGFSVFIGISDRTATDSTRAGFNFYNSDLPVEVTMNGLNCEEGIIGARELHEAHMKLSSIYAPITHSHNDYAAKNHYHTGLYAYNNEINGSAFTVYESGGTTAYRAVAGYYQTGQVCNLGSPGVRWDNIYSSKELNVPSDERIKEGFQEFTEDIVSFFMDLKPGSFRYKNVRDTDKHDRVHWGMRAQEVELALKQHSMTAMDAAFLCKDKVGMEKDENGNFFNPYEKYGIYDELYGLRYGELPPLNTYMIQRNVCRIELQEKRMDMLENRLEDGAARDEALEERFMQALEMIAALKKQVDQLSKNMA